MATAQSLCVWSNFGRTMVGRIGRKHHISTSCIVTLGRMASKVSVEGDERVIWCDIILYSSGDYIGIVYSHIDNIQYVHMFHVYMHKTPPLVKNYSFCSSLWPTFAGKGGTWPSFSHEWLFADARCMFVAWLHLRGLSGDFFELQMNR